VTVTPPDDDVLWTRSLTKGHQGTPALRDVSLGIRTGEVLAVAGPRGCGKSTLLACLGAVLTPDAGEVWFKSAPLHTFSRAARERLRRERFGLIGPEPRLVPELTVRENVALPLLLSGAGRRTANAAAAEWLERLDVADCARRLPSALTQEQRQRAAVARALAHGPEVVLADEPTAPLHREAGEQVMRILVAAARSHGVTLVLTGQDAREAGRHADRIALMADGRVALPVAAAELVPGLAGAGAAAASASASAEADALSAAAAADAAGAASGRGLPAQTQGVRLAGAPAAAASALASGGQRPRRAGHPGPQQQSPVDAGAGRGTNAGTGSGRVGGAGAGEPRGRESDTGASAGANTAAATGSNGGGRDRADRGIGRIVGGAA